jgi:hypothetical protein
MAQIKEAVATAEIAPLHPFDEQAALAWLRGQPEGRTNLLPGALGERWGWHALAVGRRLKAWGRAGLIKPPGAARSRWWTERKSPHLDLQHTPRPRPSRCWCRTVVRLLPARPR